MILTLEGKKKNPVEDKKKKFCGMSGRDEETGGGRKFCPRALNNTMTFISNYVNTLVKRNHISVFEQ